MSLVFLPPFILATHKGELEVVKLLTADPRIDTTLTTKGMTAFHGACIGGNKEVVVEYLLGDEQLDLNVQADDGVCAMIFAARGGPHRHTHPAAGRSQTHLVESV